MKEDSLEYILANKSKVIADKLEQIKFTDANSTVLKRGFNINSVAKADSTNNNKSSSPIATIVGNTYLWMDSHRDVHLEGCFGDDLKEDRDRFHLADHEFKISAQLGYPQAIYEKKIKWRDLNIDKDGETEALFMDSKLTDKYNPSYYSDYINGEIKQHSVGMFYIDLDIAANNEDYPEEKELWDEIYPKLGNPETADKYNYFWVVRKCGLREISAVLAGSNSLTPTYSVEGKAIPVDDYVKTKEYLKAFLSK